MSLSDIIASPIFWSALVFGLFLLLQLLHWRRRQKKLHAFIAKYQLRAGWAWKTAPEPGIRGLLWPTGYPLWLEGWIDNVRVVAFDYEIGFGRGTRAGSGVGIQRRVANQPALAPGMKILCNGDWTFLFTKVPSLWIEKKLDPEEMERLWFELLHAPAQDGETSKAMASGSGEVHIPPRRA